MSTSDRLSARRLRVRPLVLFAFVLVAALARVVPHPPNFTPVGALALFAGATFVSRLRALILPLAAMLISDGVLWALHGWELGAMTLVIYSSIAAISGLGRRMNAGRSVTALLGTSFLAALAFFLITNFAVWLGSGNYPLTGAGLVACFVAALPFFGNTLAAQLFFGALLFGGFELLQRRFAVLRVAPAGELQ